MLGPEVAPRSKDDLGRWRRWVNDELRLLRSVRGILERGSVGGGVVTIRQILTDPTGPMQFWNRDYAVVPSPAGTSIATTLTFLPKADSLIVWLNGVALEPGEWSLSGATVTIPQSSTVTFKTDDRFTFWYAYDATNPAPPPAPPSPGFIETALTYEPLWLGVQDDTSGSVLTDYSGYGRDGTYSGPALGAAQVCPNLVASGRTSASYDGTDDMANQSAAWGAWINTTQVAFVAWVNLDTIGTGSPSGYVTIITRNNGVTFASAGLRINGSGQAEFFVITNTGTYTAVGTTTLTTGTDFMISGIYDGSDVQVFVNDDLDGSTPANGNLLTSSVYGYTLGGAGGFQLFDGRIGPVAMYDPSLGVFDAAAIPALYAAGAAA